MESIFEFDGVAWVTYTSNPRYVVQSRRALFPYFGAGFLWLWDLLTQWISKWTVSPAWGEGRYWKTRWRKKRRRQWG